MKENTDKRELFREALIDARLHKSWRALSEERDPEAFSETHEQTMRAILNRGNKRSARSGRKQIIASLLTVATVAAAAFALYVNRSAFLPDPDTPPTQQIDKIYSLSYVPEGYEIVSTSAELGSNLTRWENDVKEYIIFEQSVIGSSEQNYDTLAGRHERISIGTLEVHCIFTDYSSIYLWEFRGYSYKIECSNGLAVDEVTQMIIAFLRDNGYIE